MSNSKLKKKYMVDDNERVNSKIINETSKIGLEFNVMPNKLSVKHLQQANMSW